MKSSKYLKKEIKKVDNKINRLKAQIIKLEEQKYNLTLELHNAEFEENHQWQFINRFEVDSFRHYD